MERCEPFNIIYMGCSWQGREIGEMTTKATPELHGACQMTMG